MQQTIQQQIAEAEAKVARLKEKARKEETAEKIIWGGLILSQARKNPRLARWLSDIAQHEAREIDLKRIQSSLADLQQIGSQPVTEANNQSFNNLSGDENNDI